MIYAISDVHGCHNALVTVLDMLPLAEGDVIIALGDYIDRGEDTRGVLEVFLEFRQQHIFHHLVGNHELMLSDALTSSKAMAFFTGSLVGGSAMVDSYGGSLDNVPKEHWDFLLKEALPYMETDEYIFVHGGVEPALPLSEQGLSTLAWKRFHESEPHISGKKVICGHTIIGDVPQVKGGHTVCIDTGAGKGGWVTVLQVDTGKYFQANEEGEKLTGLLEGGGS